MSCDWDIHCRDCSTRMGIDDANHMELELVQFISSPSFIPFVLAGLGLPHVIDVELGLRGRKIDFYWLRDHACHQLVVVSEYGEESGKCAQRVVCACCGVQRGYCGLEKDHKGDHTPVDR